MNRSPDITFKLETGMPITDGRKGRLTKCVVDYTIHDIGTEEIRFTRDTGKKQRLLQAALKLEVGQYIVVSSDTYAAVTVRARMSDLGPMQTPPRIFKCRKTVKGIQVIRLE